MPPNLAGPIRTIRPRNTTTQEAPVSVFTPPPACSTALATILGGECSGYPNVTCQTWSPDEIINGGFVMSNMMYRNESNKFTGPISCFPPEYVTFDWAVGGCPDGFTTAESWSDNQGVDVGTTTGICCPPGYNKPWRNGNWIWECSQTLTTTGQTMIVEAIDVVSSGTATYVNGTYYPGFFQTFSLISTTVINVLPTGTQSPITIVAGGVPFRTYNPPASTALPPTPSDCGDPTTFQICFSSPPTDHRYSIAHLGFSQSIVVTILIILAGCILLGWLIIWSRRKPKSVVYQNSHSASSSTVVASTLRQEEHGSPVTAVASRDSRVEVEMVPMADLSEQRNAE